MDANILESLRPPPGFRVGFRMQGRKTTTRAFRIDETVDRQLREWAEREGVSVSFLANKALRRLVEWDMYADRFGFIAMPREALSRMIELLSEDEVRDLGRWVRKRAGPLVQGEAGAPRTGPRGGGGVIFHPAFFARGGGQLGQFSRRFPPASTRASIAVMRARSSLFSSFNLSSSSCCSTFFAASACFSRSVAIAFRAFVRRLLIGSASAIRSSSSSAFGYPSSPSPNVAPSRVR